MPPMCSPQPNCSTTCPPPPAYFSISIPGEDKGILTLLGQRPPTTSNSMEMINRPKVSSVISIGLVVSHTIFFLTPEVLHFLCNTTF